MIFAVPSKTVIAVAGKSTTLPCDLTPRSKEDSVQVLMWLRDGTHTPLFRYVVAAAANS